MKNLIFGIDLLKQLVPPHLQMDAWFIERMLNNGKIEGGEEEEGE